jgi:hypothetical protein
MTVEETLAANLDAGDYTAAALAILAHPGSILLRRKSVEKLFSIGHDGVVVERIDEAMIDAIANYMFAIPGCRA